MTHRCAAVIISSCSLFLAFGCGAEQEPATPELSALVITTTSVPDGIAGVAYDASLSATGGDGSYTWSIVEGSLPNGLRLSASGEITGTPTGEGVADISVGVASGDGQTARQSLTIVVQAALAVKTAVVPLGVVGMEYAVTLEAKGGDGSYTWSLVAGSLPDGLDLSGSGGITGAPTTAGTSTATVMVQSGDGQTAQRALVVTVNAALMVNTASVPDAVVNVAYATTLEATGGDGSYVWSVEEDSLPSGLSLATSGTLSGTPTTAGVADVTIRVASGDGQSVQRAFPITVEGWDWTPIETSLGATFSYFRVHPGDDDVWYAYGSQTTGATVAFNVSHDAGATWTTPFTDLIHGEALAFDTRSIDRVLVGTVKGELYESTDRGVSWKLGHDFTSAYGIVSVHVGAFDGALYVAGTQGSGPRGIYRSADGGATFAFLPYGVPDDWQVIPWDVEQSPITGAIFVPIEMADHLPSPYLPPLLRSLNGGASWSDVSGDWWHGTKVEIDAVDGTVYFQLEGPGLRRSEDDGDTWVSRGQNGVSMRLDRTNRNRLYVGWYHYDGNQTPGGVYMSLDRGDSFQPIGFEGETVLDVELNNAGSVVFAVVRSLGLFRADVPPALPLTP